MASSGTPLAELLRNVADQLENAPNVVNSIISPPPQTPRHPVDAEVVRLFAPYARGRGPARKRSIIVSPQLHSYTHRFCCLEDKHMELVPNRSVKQMLEAAGLGEKRLTFQGSPTSPEEFKDFILSSFPKLRDGGGFEILKIAGSTRSQQLMVIPCPNSGYTIILDKITWPTHDDEEDIEVSLEDTCRVSGFLRTFIENASSKQLEKLVQFWVGWNVVPRSLDVKVVENSFPKSSTCFHLLKLPRHYTEYSSFKTDIIAAISTVDTGFGMI
ncbi:hypothetical protein XENORESO_006221 [Xenotaenia resolanae]|uniref:HECT domain-containing protein n=1 Tax=Xenotaenia resolanae TaxID=208358 RepID=A0ABV0WXC7_9TELE